MSDGISFFSNDDLNKHVKNVMSQTNYTEEQAIDKLKLFNCDYIRVIKDYMGIPEKKKERNVKSVNQEIFRLLKYGGNLLILDSLNHNLAYKMNRRLHYYRGRRTKSTLNRVPDKKRIISLSKKFSYIVNVLIFIFFIYQ